MTIPPLRTPLPLTLRQVALGLFPPSSFPTLHRQLLTTWAESLEAKRRYRQAMLAYLSITPPLTYRAAQAAKQGDDWRMALPLLSQAIKEGTAPEGESVQAWAGGMAKAFVGYMGPLRRARLRDAAEMMTSYLQDVEGAIMALINGR